MLETRGLLIAGILLAASAARAQMPDMSAAQAAADSAEALAPPVDALVEEALDAAPSLAASRARLEAAEQMVAPAGALPDPMLELAFQDAGFPDWTIGEEEMSMIGPQITQVFPFPGKQNARKETAKAGARIQEREVFALQRAIAFQVRGTYAALYRIDRELELLRASRDLVDLLTSIAAHHTETGDMNLEAVMKARILLSRLEEDRADLQAERRRTEAVLNRWLDRPGDAPLGRVTALPEAKFPEAAWDSLALARSSEVQIREAEVAAAERKLGAARMDLRPDFLAGAGIGFRGDLDPVVTFRLGLELPLWQGKKQRPLIRAAESELEAARHELRDARARAGSEVAELRAAWERSLEQIVRYEESLVPQTSLALDAARSAYLGGRADFSTVIEDFNLWLEARAGLARREAELYTTWARIDALVSPPPVMPEPAKEGNAP